MHPLRTAGLLVLAILAACQNDDEPLPDPTPEPVGNTVVTISMHHFFGANAFDTTATYLDAGGNEFRIGRIRWFMAQPLFINDVGDTVKAFPERYLLIDSREGATVRTIGELSGHLHELHCGIGVDPGSNHADPDTMPSPLDDPGMHTGSQADGYKFLVIEGRYDSDADDDVDANDAPFLFECTTDALFTPGTIDIHEDADQGGNLILDLDLHVDQLMAGVNIVDDPVITTPGPTTQALMTDLATSITHP